MGGRGVHATVTGWKKMLVDEFPQSPLTLVNIPEEVNGGGAWGSRGRGKDWRLCLAEPPPSREWSGVCFKKGPCVVFS